MSSLAKNYKRRKISFDKQEILVASVPIRNISSFYTKYGDWFALICTLILIITILPVWFQKKS